MTSTISSRARHASGRAKARWTIACLLAGAIAACSDFRTLEPAVTVDRALETPGLVGDWVLEDGTPQDWGVQDTVHFQIRRTGGRVPEYVVGAVNLSTDESMSSSGPGIGHLVAPEASRASHFDARVARMGGALVVELTPSVHADSALQDLMEQYSPLILATHMLLKLEVGPDQLRAYLLLPDSVLRALQQHRCDTPYLAEEDLLTSTTTLTGSSEQVLRAYECLLRQPEVLAGPFVLRRAPSLVP